MAIRTHLLPLFMLLCISQAYSTFRQKKYTAMKAEAAADADGAMKALQTKIRYQFNDQVLLTRAMTHASYSFDNNGALGVLGSSIIQAAISLRYVLSDSAMGSGPLYSKIAELSNCTALSKDAFELQLPGLIRVAPKVNPKKESIVCGCYHALFGAIAADAKNLDVARDKFWARQKWNSPKLMQKNPTQEGRRFERLDKVI